MASPAEIGQNLPDTLPEDFGDWDGGESSAPAPSEAPSRETREAAPKESTQRELARREAEAVDFASKPYTSREVSREYEPARNVTPFPERDELPTSPRGGIPAPVVRAPRTAPAAAAAVAAPAVQDDNAYLRLMKSLDTVVDKLPATETTKVEESKGSPVTLVERRPDKPLFSSIAAAKEDEAEVGPGLLSDLEEDEQERKTRRKWITTACIFGGSLLLVTFQLFHYYGSSAKLKHIVPTAQPVAASNGSQVVEPEANPANPTDINANDIPTVTEKPSAAKPAGEAQSQQSNENSDLTDDTQSAAPEPQNKKPATAQKWLMQTQLMAPTRLPQNIKNADANDAPPPATLGGASIAALNGNSTAGNVFAGKSKSQVLGPHTVNVSAGVAVGLLIHKTQPVYPAIAKSARVQGTVVLNATITSTGKVTNVRVVSGPPMLRQPAIDAVKTWVYRPYLLNNYPTDVDTTVNVQFTLGG